MCPQTENDKKFSLETRRLAESVGGLNTSLAPAAGELWPKEYRPLQRPAQGWKGSSKDRIFFFA